MTSSSATSPRTDRNQVWLTDITEHHSAEGKLYLCAVKDVWLPRIIGCAIDDRMPSHLAVDALRIAVTRRGGAPVVAGCVVHIDPGAQFRCRRYVHELERHELRGSWAGPPPAPTTPPWRAFRPAAERRRRHPPLAHATKCAQPSSPGSSDQSLNRTRPRIVELHDLVFQPGVHFG
ncbi:DDE-type integrase/transposase/recombinase [Terrabacter sp. Ter38]|uniref:DDE-type integrase/transposase/recombinase n=1 Tax=Terrabacter sp. Ter38 TaxID=2926030 RepID=UPI0035B0B847